MKSRDVLFNTVIITLTALATIAMVWWVVASNSHAVTAVQYGAVSPEPSVSASPPRAHTSTVRPSTSTSQNGAQSNGNKIIKSSVVPDTRQAPIGSQSGSGSQGGASGDDSTFTQLRYYCAKHPENAHKCAPVFRADCVGLAYYNDQPESVKQVRRARGEFADQHECEAYFDRQ